LEPFELEGDPALRGEAAGEGVPVVLCHGITATRGQVLHGSNFLARQGYRPVLYDARGHGQSDPAPEGEGYGYPWLGSDLERVVSEQVGDRPFILGGHSMGAHTAVAYALENAGRLAGLVVIGPVYRGTVDDEVLEGWDSLGEALARGGIDGFLEELERQGMNPEWRDSILRFTRMRMEAHRDLGAVAQALHEVPRSRPFDDLSELEFLDVPALVVASNDIADRGHPYAVAEAYAELLPQARLISEREGDSPLAWQGGRLSREIANFAAEAAVVRRLETAA
jgi:pimeloyl-ACP methyl ester carboxylesterase